MLFFNLEFKQNLVKLKNQLKINLSGNINNFKKSLQLKNYYQNKKCNCKKTLIQGKSTEHHMEV